MKHALFSLVAVVLLGGCSSMMGSGPPPPPPTYNGMPMPMAPYVQMINAAATCEDMEGVFQGGRTSRTATVVQSPSTGPYPQPTQTMSASCNTIVPASSRRPPQAVTVTR